MNDLTLKVYIWLRTLMVCEEAQDLVEYALLLTLIACGVILGAKDLAVGIDHAYDSLALSVRHYTRSGHSFDD
jgi:Flp pilus assembly pilin Flp